MKQFLPVVWWLTATLVIAFVLVGLGYLFADALLLGVLFLPGMLTARYFVPQLSFENRRQGILDTVYLDRYNDTARIDLIGLFLICKLSFFF